ncbi:hypothetical protein DB30_03421 [Enhygromyxa salina]|uniref:Uncharacterized protein n=1 Tax=Enhygromyxa salina TaxID=215803 RepID=A0A0C1ZIK1_9BACT|nr:hypothetical protein DB30_03421 [Enhygromyxa salina]
MGAPKLSSCHRGHRIRSALTERTNSRHRELRPLAPALHI